MTCTTESGRLLEQFTYRVRPMGDSQKCTIRAAKMGDAAL
jgi:hypothetical protein